MKRQIFDDAPGQTFYMTWDCVIFSHLWKCLVIWHLVVVEIKRQPSCDLKYSPVCQLKQRAHCWESRIYLHDGEISIIHFYTVIMSNPIWYNDFGLIDSVSQQLIFHHNCFCCHEQTTVAQLLKCFSMQESFSFNLCLVFSILFRDCQFGLRQ